MTGTPDLLMPAQVPPADAVQPIDAAKVEHLRRAIAAGEYAINQELIAAKLIEHGFPDEIN